ncbi:MAG: N-6 DNA methylase [Minisyncoccota bacterium]
MNNRQEPVSRNAQDKQKRLGQFFTGPNLARLLVALAEPPGVTSAVDPMCGTGDMLKAVQELFPRANLSGIEIDANVLKGVTGKIKSLPASKLTLIQGDSFELRNIKKLSRNNFDLVITNPPYVRYQSLGVAKEKSECKIPSASQVRENLLKSSDFLLTDPEDKKLFHEIIQGYSGLSDLAVPSWILAAMLTKVGGTLALVLPESWLSRDYARIIQYILLRWFRIRYVVEDTNAAWFPGASVKTTLLVAERIHRRSSAFLWQEEFYAHIQISGDASTTHSVIGNIYPGVKLCEKKFAKEVASLLVKGEQKEASLWSLDIVRISETADKLKGSIGGDRWFSTFESLDEDTKKAVVPIKLQRWLKESTSELRSLESMDIVVGQGLRTGANPFFYVDLVETSGVNAVISPNKILDINTINIPKKYLHPVLRRQIELPVGYRVKKTSLKGRVLILPLLKTSGGLKKLITTAERTKIGDKIIPELSAVKTNIKKGAAWYVLPPLAPRHIPTLLVPRINGGAPRVYKNDVGLIVDANFSTIWLKKSSSLTPAALLALLNSSWVIANMELSGAIMGAGALKIEAVHLKRISLPVLNNVQIKKLDSLGRELLQSGDSRVVQHIDMIIVEGMFKKSLISDKLKELHAIIQRKFEERAKRI